MAPKNRPEKIKRDGLFRPGKAGCESLLYEVRGYYRGTITGTEMLELSEEEKRRKFDILKIAANDVHELVAYVQKWEEDFRIREIVLLDLIVLLSGSPLN